ncbi:MAG: hypothetical protein K9M45_06090 [Kiritimatiellales bacterium]|nr:hypothetical protein [Kiritimatiellales bacterium]
MKHISHQIRRISLISLILSANAFALDTEFHGFVDGRAGMRTQNDPYEDQQSLAEIRAQLDSLTYLDAFTLQIRADLVYDALADDPEKIDLQTGEGFIDLREFNILFTPVDWADVKLGRQILTWGTGDLLFINDLFPKDWNSFFLGRDTEYLKAPSDAIYASLFPSFGSIDIAYTPRFDADRYIDGSRISYWNQGLNRIAGQDAIIKTDVPNNNFEDDEIAARFYRSVKGYEAALYFYSGFWKSPAGADPVSGKATFPNLNVYGASAKGTLGSGIVSTELGYYDSRDDSGGGNPFVRNSEFRFLAGYERELAKNFSAGIQYYLEHMMDHNDYLDGLPSTKYAADENRHVVTLRLTRMLMNQNLILSLFTYYSPSDHDVYLRPVATYKLDDHWKLTANGNFFIGQYDHTFFGQFKNNNNVNLGVRYSY